MADTLDPENAAFWLPSSFLTDDEDNNINDSNNNNNNDDLFFASSLDSPVSSTETELGDGSHNDDDFVSELTRHLAHSSLHDSFNEKPWNISTSPQSTLSGFGPFTTRSGFSSNGSPNGPSPRVPSPPVTPPAKNDAAWELLYEAASQVARLKMNALAAEINHHRYNHHNNHLNRGLLGAPRNVSVPSKPLHHHSHHSLYEYEQVKRQGNGNGNGNLYCNHHHHQHQHQQQRRSCNGGPAPGPWAQLRPNHRQPNGSIGPGMRSVFVNGPGSGIGPGPGPGIKRQSTGTGVFLPRRAGTTTQQQPPEPRKRPTGCSTWIPGRVMDALNAEVEEVSRNPRGRFGSGMLSEQELIMARRNAVMEQQRRSLMRNDEIRLPSDWTY